MYETDVRAAAAWPQSTAEFGALVDAVQHGLVRFAFCRLRNRADAEDVVQDVLVRAFVDRARLRRVTAVEPYLYRMVANRCTDVLRRRARQPAGSGELATPPPDPEASQIELIEALLEHLPVPQAEAIRLRVFAELPFEAAAIAAGVPLATIKSRFRYGLERLRKLMGRKEVV